VVRAWDPAVGTLVWEHDLAGAAPGTLASTVARLAFTGSDASGVAVAFADGSVTVVEAADGTIRDRTVPARSEADAGGAGDGAAAPARMALSTDGSQLVRTEADGTITVWQVADGSAVGAPMDPPSPVLDVTFGAGEEVLALLETGFALFQPGPQPTFAGPLATGVVDGLRVAFTPDPAGWVVASSNQGVRHLALSSLAAADVLWETVDARPRPQAIAVAPDGHTVVVGFTDGRVGILDLAPRFALARPLAGAPSLPGTTAGPVPAEPAMAIRPDGGAVAWYDADSGAIGLHDLDGGQVTSLPTSGPTTGLAISADGGRVASIEMSSTGTGGPDARWFIRDLPGGAVTHEGSLGPDGWTIAVTADGRRVALGSSRGALQVVDAATGERVWQAPDDPDRLAITSLAFADDGIDLLVGARMATGAAPRATVLHVDVGTGIIEVMTAIEADRISALAYRSDDRSIAIAAADDQARRDGQLLLMDSSESQPMGWLGAPGDTFAALRFSPEGGTLLSGGPDSGWMAWDVSLDGWAERACRIAGRDLTQQEWLDHLEGVPYHATCSDPRPIPNG
jgi:WD40 repeat protein